MPDSLSLAVQQLFDLLNAHQLRVAFAESCTGGLLSHALTQLPGSSKVFWGSVVSYENDAKVKLLNVKTDSLQQFGAVSAEVAQEMAEGILRLSGVSYAISITGIAGPSGGTPTKPIGLVWMALASASKPPQRRAFHFQGSRTEIQRAAATAACQWLIENIHHQK